MAKGKETSLDRARRPLSIFDMLRRNETSDCASLQRSYDILLILLTIENAGKDRLKNYTWTEHGELRS